jgi:hypothetical protein
VRRPIPARILAGGVTLAVLAGMCGVKAPVVTLPGGEVPAPPVIRAAAAGDALRPGSQDPAICAIAAVSSASLTTPSNEPCTIPLRSTVKIQGSDSRPQSMVAWTGWS